MPDRILHGSEQLEMSRHSNYVENYEGTYYFLNGIFKTELIFFLEVSYALKMCELKGVVHR